MYFYPATTISTFDFLFADFGFSKFLSWLALGLEHFSSRAGLLVKVKSFSSASFLLSSIFSKNFLKLRMLKRHKKIF